MGQLTRIPLAPILQEYFTAYVVTQREMSGATIRGVVRRHHARQVRRRSRTTQHQSAPAGGGCADQARRKGSVRVSGHFVDTGSNL
jgi:hypothetical protein